MLDAALHDVAVTTPVDLNLAARGANATVRVHAMRENCPEGVRLLVALRALAPGDPPGTSTAPGRSAAHIGHLEAELARARGDLEEQLLLRTEDLRAFNYSVSHDLRGPVRAITGFANFLREDIGADDLAAAAHTAARIAAAGERLDEMLEKLLQFSMRAEAALNLQAVAQEELVREVIDQLPDHHAGISIGKLPAATCDRILIGEVWTNLISNAIKYSARETSPVIGIGHADGAYFVRDNGVGFDMGDYRRLFGLFNRLHADQEFCGTGAGLAIARRIVAHHGGTMWATSEPGRGATFCFTLGAAQQATANPATIP
jgi:light-regulated signal transduction histidine kinase (bacteriophytochrome)